MKWADDQATAHLLMTCLHRPSPDQFVPLLSWSYLKISTIGYIWYLVILNWQLVFHSFFWKCWSSVSYTYKWSHEAPVSQSLHRKFLMKTFEITNAATHLLLTTTTTLKFHIPRLLSSYLVCGSHHCCTPPGCFSPFEKGNTPRNCLRTWRRSWSFYNMIMIGLTLLHTLVVMKIGKRTCPVSKDLLTRHRQEFHADPLSSCTGSTWCRPLCWKTW